MNSLRNKVSLIGRLGQEPVMRTGEKNDFKYQVTNFTLATNERFKNKKGEWVDNTQWYNMVGWGKTAEKICKLLTKGQEVMIEGRLVLKSQVIEGEKRNTTEIEVSDFIPVVSRPANKLEETTELETAEK
jgi:single-strand DNA-binding protein